MLISTKIVRCALLVSLSCMINVQLIQAAKPNYGSIKLNSHPDDYEEELSLLEKTFRYLSLTDEPIRIADSEKLFAEHFIKYILNLESEFSALRPHQKKELMGKFLDTLWSLKHGNNCDYIEKQKIINVLALDAVQDLIDKNSKNQDLVQYLKCFKKKSEALCNDPSNKSYTKTARAILPHCILEYETLSLNTEVSYMHILSNVSADCTMKESLVKALLLACIKQCDSDCSQDLDSLSILDLEHLWRQMCGSECNALQKLIIALSGSDETSLSGVFRTNILNVGFGSGITGIAFLIGFAFSAIGGHFDNDSFGNLMIFTGVFAIVLYVVILSKHGAHYLMTTKI